MHVPVCECINIALSRVRLRHCGRKTRREEVSVWMCVRVCGCINEAFSRCV